MTNTPISEEYLDNVDIGKQKGFSADTALYFIQLDNSSQLAKRPN